MPSFVPHSSWIRGALTAVALAFAAGSLASAAPKSDPAGPDFTRIGRVIESQPIAKPRLVYWDQTLADRLGIRTPPGRPGIPEFDRAVAAMMAFEIKEGAGHGEKITARMRAGDGKPYIYVEKDAHDLAGRAGYIEIQPGIWVNVKGLGHTKGKDQDSGDLPGPPSRRYSDHADGAATLKEAVKEAILARAMDAETRRGSSRVLAILSNGRTMRYPGGENAPLAAIVRAPLKRWDQGPQKRPAALTDSLAQANASRFMKGDFVNTSNLGAEGEFIDFGCMTQLCGFVNASSTQGEAVMDEGAGILPQRATYRRQLGENLLMQLGIPEARVRALTDEPSGAEAAAERLRSLGDAFAALVGSQRKLVVHSEELPRSSLEGSLRLHMWFRDLAADFLASTDRQAGRFPRSGLKSLQELSRQARVSRGTQLLAKRLLSGLLETLGPIRAAIPPSERAAYAGNVRRIAHFRNRDVDSLVRPLLFSRVDELADAFARVPDPDAVQAFIEDAVFDGRVGTTPASDAWIVARADSKATELFVRRHEDGDGVSRLFRYPDLAGAGPGESFGFRVSTDGGKTSEDLEASKVATSVGDQFRIAIPHGRMPVTPERVVLTPYVRRKDGSLRWLRPDFDLRGPPLLFNERLGLEPGFERLSDGMRDFHGRPIRTLPIDLDPPSSLPRDRIPDQELAAHMRELDDPDPSIRDGAADFLSRHPRYKAVIEAMANPAGETVEKQGAILERRLAALGHDPSRLPLLRSRLWIEGRIGAKDALEPEHRAETLRLAESLSERSPLSQRAQALLKTVFGPETPDADALACRSAALARGLGTLLKGGHR